MGSAGVPPTHLKLGVRARIDNMTYQEQVTATLIGTFFGFIGSLILFWIKNSWEARQRKKALLKNLGYELDYNINLFLRFEEQLTKLIEVVSADSRDLFLSLNYGSIARFFAIQFYQAGLIAKYLHPEDMKRWNDFLTTLGEGSEAYAVNTVTKWRNSEIDKEGTFQALKYERDQVKYAREFSEYLKGKILP